MTSPTLRFWLSSTSPLCGIDSKTIRRLRANDNMETKTLNKLCSVLNCRMEDIAEYVPDE